MEIRELASGEHGPEDSDRVRLTQCVEDGKHTFMGIRLKGNVTDHTVWTDSYDTEDEALTAALIWAEDNGVETLYVERPE